MDFTAATGKKSIFETSQEKDDVRKKLFISFENMSNCVYNYKVL